MSMYLVDTTTSRDVLINDALVSQGLALFLSDTEEDSAGVESYSLEKPQLGVSVCMCACVHYVCMYVCMCVCKYVCVCV